MTMTMAVARRRSSSIGWMSVATHYHRPSAVLAQLDPNKVIGKEVLPIVGWCPCFFAMHEKLLKGHIQDINSQVAQFRDLLINIGQPRDCPELRERIRKLRRSCVEACKSTSQLVLPQMRSAMELGIPADSPNLVLLFFVSQLFLRELYKSKNLVRIVPMDMSGYYESKAGPSNIGNVISQILLCKQITPDFNEEEICSIRKDSEEISALIAELQEFMPQCEADTERTVALQELGTRPSRNNGNGKSFRWDSKTRHPSYFRGGFNLLCCAARPNYI